MLPDQLFCKRHSLQKYFFRSESWTFLSDKVCVNGLNNVSSSFWWINCGWDWKCGYGIPWEADFGSKAEISFRQDYASRMYLRQTYPSKRSSIHHFLILITGKKRQTYASRRGNLMGLVTCCNLTHSFAALARICFQSTKFANGIASKNNLSSLYCCFKMLRNRFGNI